MEIREINRYEENGIHHVTYKFWETGKCACTATKISRSFTVEPAKQDLINAI